MPSLQFFSLTECLLSKLSTLLVQLRWVSETHFKKPFSKLHPSLRSRVHPYSKSRDSTPFSILYPPQSRDSTQSPSSTCLTGPALPFMQFGFHQTVLQFNVLQICGCSQSSVLCGVTARYPTFLVTEMSQIHLFLGPTGLVVMSCAVLRRGKYYPSLAKHMSQSKVVNGCVECKCKLMLRFSHS